MPATNVKPELSAKPLADLTKDEIRFASIPKSGSRSLKEVGLLGEVPGTCHSKITDYPAWQNYRWIAVLRDKASWRDSWWRSCRRRKDAFTVYLGFTFESMAKDMARLSDAAFIRSLPAPPRVLGLHAWIPNDFPASFSAALGVGRDFQEYATAYICDGVAVDLVTLPDLDAFQISKGVTPIRMNVGIP